MSTKKTAFLTIVLENLCEFPMASTKIVSSNGSSIQYASFYSTKNLFIKKGIITITARPPPNFNSACRLTYLLKKKRTIMVKDIFTPIMNNIQTTFISHILWIMNQKREKIEPIILHIRVGISQISDHIKLNTP